MLTIAQLILQLNRLVKEDKYRKEMYVSFGADIAPVAGGIIRKDSKGIAILNLAPIKLDKTGGF